MINVNQWPLLWSYLPLASPQGSVTDGSTPPCPVPATCRKQAGPSGLTWSWYPASHGDISGTAAGRQSPSASSKQSGSSERIQSTSSNRFFAQLIKSGIRISMFTFKNVFFLHRDILFSLQNVVPDYSEWFLYRVSTVSYTHASEFLIYSVAKKMDFVVRWTYIA